MDRRAFLQTATSGFAGALMTARLDNRSASARTLQGSGPQFELPATDAILVNPGVGLETFHQFNADLPESRRSALPPCSIAYFRFYWDKLEPREGAYNFDLVGSLLDQASSQGQSVALRFMPTSKGGSSTPAWYRESAKGFTYKTGNREGWAPDHNEPRFLASQEALVAAFGERFNGDPRLIRMEIGSVGFWGEWHLTSTEPRLPEINEDNAVKVVDMYLRHWDRTPLCMLIHRPATLRYALKHGTGWRADSLGDYGHFSETWHHMRDSYPAKLKEAGALDMIPRGPVAFEPPGTMRDLERYVPSHGGYDAMYDQALAWYGSAFNPKIDPIPEDQFPSIRRFLARCGYRLALRQMQIASPPRAGDQTLAITATVENQGVAPPCKPYRLSLRLDRGGQPIVLHAAVDPRDWLPGIHRIKEELALSDPIPAGDYQLSIALLDPSTPRPAVELANQGKAPDSWYPLGTLTITG